LIRTALPLDEALPQLQRLLDPDAMAPFFESMLDGALPVGAVQIAYVRYKPGRRLLVSYDVDVGDAVDHAAALTEVGADLARTVEDNAPIARKATSRSAARTPLLHVAELDALIQWHPVDVDLPALAEPAERLRDALGLAGLELEEDDVPRLLKHKPMNRAVMRLNRHILKVYASPSAFAGSLHAIHKAASAPVPTARCEAVVPKLRVTAQSVVPGTRPEDDAEIAPRAGALLASLHGADVRGLRLEPPADQLDDARGNADLVAALLPPLADRVERLMHGLELALPDDALVTSHGGFRASQLLESNGQLGVIDFDGFCRAPAARDLASFAAALVDGADDLPRAAQVLDVLVDAYGSRPPGLAWYLATYVLRRTRRPFTRLEVDWPTAVEERLRAAELALEL
jgi:Ser/Thr protein kinase RdoA (MazF antagonist)